MVGRQNAHIADILHLRDVAMATTFWLLMSYNFGCMIASDTLFGSRGGFSGSSYPMKTYRFRRDVAMAAILAFYIWSAHWRHLANTIEPSMCGGAAASCQITLPLVSTCYHTFGRVELGQFSDHADP